MTEIHSKKLRRFAASVNYEIEEQIEQIKLDAEAEREVLLKNTEERVLQESFIRIQRAVKDIEYKYRRAAALQEYEHNIEVLKHRSVLTKMIFAFVEQKIIGFVSSEGYADFLLRQLKNEDLSGAVIKVSKKDMQYAQMLEKASGCSVEEDDDILFGGLAIYYREKGFVNDKTFDNALNEQIESFSSKYSFGDTGTDL